MLGPPEPSLGSVSHPPKPSDGCDVIDVKCVTDA